MRPVNLIIMLLLICSLCRGQEDQKSAALENLAERAGEDVENDQLLLHLDYLREKPLHANKVTARQLEDLNILSPLQVKTFLQYREIFGPLISKYELQAVPGWDIDVIRKVIQFLAFTDQAESIGDFRSAVSKGRHQLLLRSGAVLENAKGFVRDDKGQRAYAGSASKLLIRYAYQYRQYLWWGITAEKDAGEHFISGRNAVDFLSFHLFRNMKGVLKTVAVGDYTINVGQGLINWQGLAFGKTSESMNVFRQGTILKPYRSAGEWNFYRGIATQCGKGPFELTSFISNRKLTANIATDSSLAGISSFSESGLHRTVAELEDRNNISLFSFGGNVEYRAGRIMAGVSVVQYKFSLPFVADNRPSNYFAFEGKQLRNSGFHYNYNIRNVFLFGEVAHANPKGGVALLQGLIMNLHRNVDLSVVYRNIQPSYHSFFSAAFTENATVNNEKGLYLGFKFILKNGWTLTAYNDYFHFPWLRSRTDASSGGSEYFLQAVWTKRRIWEVSLRFRNTKKPGNLAGGVMNRVETTETSNLRFHAERTVSRNLLISARSELIWYATRADNQKGMSLFVDARYKPAKPSLTLSSRVQYFDTGGYDSRIYAYERDMLYSYSIPSFYDNGLRYYLQLQGKLPVHKLSRSLTFSWWVRWAQTLYRNKTSIGSAQDEISGNHRSDWKCQLIVSWQGHE